jgi:two-component system chemotaxis response regulator CheY
VKTQLHDLRVLIVEDNPQAANLLKKVLGGLGIHQAYRSADGREAQQFLDAANDMVDVIICDWEMPNMTGIELLQQVRTVYPDMPFIMVTGNAEAESVEIAARYQVSGYIKKPYSPQQIADSLTTLVMTLGDEDGRPDPTRLDCN